jgi:hypothetical protein
MTVHSGDLPAVREVIASWPADVATDAHGLRAPSIEELYAPHAHAAALDPAASIVMGARGAGKSFWAGVLGDADLRTAAAIAYPRLGLDRLDVQFGFTGLAGPEGIDRDKLDAVVSHTAEIADARTFWWATILRAIDLSAGRQAKRLIDYVSVATDVDRRDVAISKHEQRLRSRGEIMLVVYDALDNVASSWPRRRLVTQALLEVVWSTRAWRAVRPKLFLRPDQLEDEELRFVELPKQRAGAVRLTWNGIDLYGLLFARLALGREAEPFGRLLKSLRISGATRD